MSNQNPYLRKIAELEAAVAPSLSENPEAVDAALQNALAIEAAMSEGGEITPEEEEIVAEEAEKTAAANNYLDGLFKLAARGDRLAAECICKIAEMEEAGENESGEVEEPGEEDDDEEGSIEDAIVEVATTDPAVQEAAVIAATTDDPEEAKQAAELVLQAIDNVTAAAAQNPEVADVVEKTAAANQYIKEMGFTKQAFGMAMPQFAKIKKLVKSVGEIAARSSAGQFAKGTMKGITSPRAVTRQMGWGGRGGAYSKGLTVGAPATAALATGGAAAGIYGNRDHIANAYGQAANKAKGLAGQAMAAGKHYGNEAMAFAEQQKAKYLPQAPKMASANPYLNQFMKIAEGAPSKMERAKEMGSKAMDLGRRSAKKVGGALKGRIGMAIGGTAALGGAAYGGKQIYDHYNQPAPVATPTQKAAAMKEYLFGK